MAPFIAVSLGTWPTAAFVVISSLVFASLAALGARVDGIRLDYLAGELAGLEGLTGSGRLNQLYLSIAYALSLTALFAYLGVI
jgi:hypothetical protein